MKNIILVLTLACAPALAGNYSIPNDAGGKIVIFETPCEDSKGLLTVTYGQGGQVTAVGCTLPMDSNYVAVMWNDGDMTVLRADELEYRE